MNPVARTFLIVFASTAAVLLVVVLVLSTQAGPPDYGRSAAAPSAVAPTVPTAEPTTSAEPSPGPAPSDAASAADPGDGTPVGLVHDAPTEPQAADVGDCYLLSDIEPTWGLGNVRLVDCGSPHHGEIVGRTDLRAPTAVDLSAPASAGPVSAAVDFAIEYCMTRVWIELADAGGATFALYTPPNLVHDGVTEEAVCARETPDPRTGSVLG